MSGTPENLRSVVLAALQRVGRSPRFIPEPELAGLVADAVTEFLWPGSEPVERKRPPEPAFYQDTLWALRYLGDNSVQFGEYDSGYGMTREEWEQAGRPVDLRVTVQTP